VIVRCASCRRVVGTLESYSYGGPEGDDHTDYRNFQPDADWYGGEAGRDSYCENCYPAAAEAEDNGQFLWVGGEDD
jgi:hypothetical protein